MIAAALALVVGLFLTWTALDLREVFLSVVFCLSTVLPTAHTEVMLELYAEVLVCSKTLLSF